VRSGKIGDDPTRRGIERQCGGKREKQGRFHDLHLFSAGK
jgi:hypothetical protein